MTNHQFHDDQSFISMIIENFVYFYVDYIIKKFRIGLTEIKTITGIMLFLTISSAVALFVGMRKNNNSVMAMTFISTPILFVVLLIMTQIPGVILGRRGPLGRPGFSSLI